MHSAKLKQVILLQLDTAAMRGPVNIREIAESIYSIVRDSEDYWSLCDKREALEAFIRSGVSELMNEKMTEEYLNANLPHVPAKYLPTFEKAKRFICINAAAGLHVLAIRATPEQWLRSARMKRSIGNYTIDKSDDDEDVGRVLTDENAGSIEDLCRREFVK